MYIGIYQYYCILISWELPNLSGTFNIDCRMFNSLDSLDLVLCNMRASRLFSRFSRADAGRWEGCCPNYFLPHVVQILERAWICWWTSESRPCMLWFLGLTWVQKRRLMPQIVAANFIAHDPLGFEIVLAFPYMVRCKQFSELSRHENFQCKNL